MILDIAQRRRAGLVEPVLHAREVAHACRVRQIVGQRPDAGEYWNEVRVRVRERELDGLRRRRRLAPQECGIEVEKSDDEFFAIVQRGFPDERHLKLHEGFTEQPRLTLQPADERRQVALVDRPLDLPHDKRLPRSDRSGVREVHRSLFDEGLDEGEAAQASIDVCAEVGIERDGSFQQERRDRLVLETAGAR